MECKLYPIDESVNQAFYDEGYLKDTSFLKDWFNGLESVRDKVRNYVVRQSESGKSVFVLGASTKGNVLLQWFGLDKHDIGYASERSPEKIGKVTIGTGIPIIGEEQARHLKPDYFLILPYAFTDEILQRENEMLKRGTKFIVPLPPPVIVTGKQKEIRL